MAVRTELRVTSGKLLDLLESTTHSRWYWAKTAELPITIGSEPWKRVYGSIPAGTEFIVWEAQPSEPIRIELSIGRIPVGHDMVIDRISIRKDEATYWTVNDGYHIGKPGDEIEVYT